MTPCVYPPGLLEYAQVADIFLERRDLGENLRRLFAGPLPRLDERRGRRKIRITIRTV